MSTPSKKPRAPKLITSEGLDALIQKMQKRSAVEEAEDLFFEAMEARTEATRNRKLAEVLRLDPDHTDARLYLLTDATLAPADRVTVLEGIVATAKKRLGTKAFRELVPHFWGFAQTRPYMRARAELAGALLAAGRRADAAAEYAAMIDLNENDNQGVRYELLPLLLAMGRKDDAAVIFKKYSDDTCAAFVWGRVLERHLAGDSPGAEKALRRAREKNPHLEAFITGACALPGRLPDMYTFGSAEEAAIYAKDQFLAWAEHPGALAWLKERGEEPVKTKKPAKRAPTSRA